MELELCPSGTRRDQSPLHLWCELRVAGRGEPSSQILEDVQGETADQSDNRDFPQERQRGNEVHIDELMQEHQGGDVAGQTEQLGHRHEPVPRLDRQGHHQQLREDQWREGNRHDVHEFRLKQQECPIHDGTPWGGAERSPVCQEPTPPTHPPSKAHSARLVSSFFIFTSV